jgi:hypothetical protein
MKQRTKAGAPRSEMDELKAILAEFEEKYGLTSAEFYKKFEAGETPDDNSEECDDSLEWAGMYEILLGRQKRQSR